MSKIRVIPGKKTLQSPELRRDPRSEIMVKVPEDALCKPGVKGRKGCQGCQFKHNGCRVTPADKLPCEGLTGYDLILAARDGVLQGTVWWCQLPKNATPQQVVEWFGGDGTSDD